MANDLLKVPFERQCHLRGTAGGHKKGAGGRGSAAASHHCFAEQFCQSDGALLIVLAYPCCPF